MTNGACAACSNATQHRRTAATRGFMNCLSTSCPEFRLNKIVLQKPHLCGGLQV
jgi:hypothetical protein